MEKMHKWIVGFIAFFFSCGNPTINHFLMVKANESPSKSKEITLIKTNDKTINIKMLSEMELNIYARELNIDNENNYYRTPPLTFIRFFVENKGEKTLEFRLSLTHFQDNLGVEYFSLPPETLKEKFTSNAYARFNSPLLYSFHYKKTDEYASKSESLSPQKKITLKPNEFGYQIIPFEKFNPSAFEYTVQLPKSLTTKTPSFYYRKLRKDWAVTP